MNAINHRPGFYYANATYRDCLIAALKHFGMTKFSSQSQFWTLGGIEWHEFDYLQKKGLEFGKASYHNVDWAKIQPNPDQRIVTHSYQEFLTICDIWKAPSVLSFDSTAGLVENNQLMWAKLIRLGLLSADIVGKVSLNWNFMLGYASATFDEDREVSFERYDEWLQILEERIEFATQISNLHKYSIDFYKCSVMAPKGGSVTPMISGHCLIKAT